MWIECKNANSFERTANFGSSNWKRGLESWKSLNHWVKGAAKKVEKLDVKVAHTYIPQTHKYPSRGEVPCINSLKNFQQLPHSHLETLTAVYSWWLKSWQSLSLGSILPLFLFNAKQMYDFFFSDGRYHSSLLSTASAEFILKMHAFSNARCLTTKY